MDAKIISLIFTVSVIPVSDFDSLIVKILVKFLAIKSRLSKPCLPVKVLAFFVFTINALTVFLFEF